jgi:diguanylate cyclase (GGDEF)-like protein/PAS domain S-box-containing protein
MLSEGRLNLPTQDTKDRDLDLAYKRAMEQLHTLSSENFFVEAAKQLALAVGTRYVMITQYHPLPVSKLKTLSFWDTNQIKDNFEFMTDDTPCGEVIAGDGEFHYFSKNIQALFPNAPGLVSLAAVSYAAAPIFDSNHSVIGHVAILDVKPLKNEKWIRSLLEAYANFAGLELERRQTQETIAALTKGYGLPIGKDCFRQLAQIAADTFDIDFAVIGQQVSPHSRDIESVAVYHRGEFLDPITYCLDDTPCDAVVGKQAEAFPTNLQQLYPDFPLLQQLNAEAYIGVPLFDSNNESIGVFGLINQKPIHQADRIKTLLEAFGTKAAYEIERIKNEETLQYYSGIVSTTDDFMSFIDRDYIFRAINQNYCSLFAKPRAEIIGHNLEELHGLETFHLLKQAIDDAIKHGETSVCEFWKNYPDGTEHFIQAKYHPYYDADKSITGVSAVARDLTELKHAQDALVQSEQRLQSLYDNTPSMFFTLGKDRQIKSVNAYGAGELGYRVDELIGKSLYDLFYSRDHQQLNSMLDNCFSTSNPIQHWELRKKHKNGMTLWVKETARLVQDQTGNDQLFIVSEDISERHKLSQKLSYQASHDALTGLINRHEFERKTQQLLDTVVEDDAHHVMCYLDLDQFKIVNDSCGHLAGDTLLKNLSSLLKLKIRKGDTLARLGGDEFGILMTHCSIEQAKTIAESIRQLIQDFNFVWQDKTYSIGASMGLVSIDKYTDSITTIMGTVDAACYAAKDAGRNRVVVYSETDQEVSQRRGDMGWVRRIQEAIEQNKFCLYCQRIIEVDPEKASKPSYELLLRLRENNGEIIPPNAFLPAAERYHLATKIDQWVIQNAFDWLANMGTEIDDFRYCTINLSGHSLDDVDFLAFVIFQAEKSNIPLNKICFEITETAAISNLAGAIKFIKELAKRGCSFALDDFGSGVSSFGYLKNLAVDFIKIDGGFVKDIANDPIDYAMVKSINDIAQVMGKKTIAEYVEDDDILAALHDIGVDYAQGYGIGRPCPIDDI